MRIICLSDTHGKHRLLKNLIDGDMIIHAGDISKDGSERSVLDFLSWFSKLDYKHKVFIAGNHDFYFEQESDTYIRKRLPPNVVYLNDSGTTIEGINIWGSPVTPRFFDWAFNRNRGADIDKHWKLIPKDTDILVTHGPPQGILDLVGKTNVGCKNLAERIAQIKPSVHLFGHIHNSYGAYVSERTKFYNTSILDEEYLLKNKPVLIEQ